MNAILHGLILGLFLANIVTDAMGATATIIPPAPIGSGKLPLIGPRIVIMPLRQPDGATHADEVCRGFKEWLTFRVVDSSLNVEFVHRPQRIALFGESTWPPTNSAVASDVLRAAGRAGVDLVMSLVLDRQEGRIALELSFEWTRGAQRHELRKHSSNDWISLAEWAVDTIAEMVGERLPAGEQDYQRAFWGLQGPDLEELFRMLDKRVRAETKGEKFSIPDAALDSLMKRNPRSLALMLTKREQSRGGPTGDQINQRLILEFPDSCDAVLAHLMQDKLTPNDFSQALRHHPGCPKLLGAVSFLTAKDLTEGGTSATPLHQVLEQHIKESRGTTVMRVICAAARAARGDGKGAAEMLSGLSLPAECGDSMLMYLLARAALASGRLDLLSIQLARAAKDSVSRETDLFPILNANQFGTNVISSPRWLDRRELESELRSVSPALLQKPYVNLMEPTAEDVLAGKRMSAVITNGLLRSLAVLGEIQLAASEQEAALTSNQILGNCHSLAMRFVQLGRAAGLRTWMVHVDKLEDGSQGFHDCVVVSVEGGNLMIDPALGIPFVEHAEFEVMDDLQAIGHHLGQGPWGGSAEDAAMISAALQLNPRSRWARCRFVDAMVRAGQMDKAVAELNRLRSDPKTTNHWDVNLVSAKVAEAQGDLREASMFLERALASNPRWSTLHFGLARVYSMLKDEAKASEHLDAAEKNNRGDVRATDVTDLSQGLRLLHLQRNSDPGNDDGLQRLRDQARKGDAISAIALAEQLANKSPEGLEEGIVLLTPLAKDGNLIAQTLLVQLLLRAKPDGFGKTAREWAERAAEQGSISAMLTAAELLYSSSLGTPDPVRALRWATLARKYGEPKAKSLIQEMELFMSAEQVAAARKLADSFVPAPAELPKGKP